MCTALWLHCVPHTYLHLCVSHTLCAAAFSSLELLARGPHHITERSWRAGKRLCWKCRELMLLLRIEAMGWKRLGVLSWTLGTVHSLDIALDMTAAHIWHSLSCAEIQFPDKLEGSLFRGRNCFECHGLLLSLSFPLVLFSFSPSFHNLSNLLSLSWAKQVSVVTQHHPRCAGRSALSPGIQNEISSFVTQFRCHIWAVWGISGRGLGLVYSMLWGWTLSKLFFFFASRLWL